MANEPGESEVLPSAPATIQHAIGVFVQGVCFTRSFTHPYLAEQVGPLWVMRDAPRRSGDYRNEEWVTYDLAAEKIDRIVQDNQRGSYTISAICASGESQEALRTGFKKLGYRLGTTESLMIHRLAQIPTFEAPAVIERVQTTEQALRLSHANRRRPVRPEYFLQDSPYRQYMATTDDEVVGWVQSISVNKAAWCNEMYVKPAFRRQGIARALLSRMLSDDRLNGAHSAVLIATHTGARLYPVVGYEQIGTLLLFTPRK